MKGEYNNSFPNGIEWTQSNITSGVFYDAFNANGVWVAGGSNGLLFRHMGTVRRN